jgi:hypothetical protein
LTHRVVGGLVALVGHCRGRRVFLDTREEKTDGEAKKERVLRERVERESQ